eukprot:g4515.t1
MKTRKHVSVRLALWDNFEEREFYFFLVKVCTNETIGYVSYEFLREMSEKEEVSTKVHDSEKEIKKKYPSKKRKRVERVVLLLRCSPFGKSALPATEKEITSLREMYEKSGAEVRTLRSGTALDLLQNLSADVTVLHIASHMDDKTLGDETILFVDDGGTESVVPAKDLVEMIAARRDSLEFVVLNGCCSKKMAFQLHREGIRSVVGWETTVNDKAAEVFAKGLHNAWIQGEAPIGAFHAAKKSVTTVTFEAPLDSLEGKEINQYVLLDPASKEIQCDPDEKWILKPKAFDLYLRTPVGVPVMFRSKYCRFRECEPPRDLVGRSFVDGLRNADVAAMTKMLVGLTTLPKMGARKVGLYGMNGLAGLGKSTLAAQLCWLVPDI